jgi:hypothetical protein
MKPKVEVSLSQADREALERAFKTAHAESAEYAEHLDAIARARGWDEAAQSAAYHLQVKNLRLKPWQAPPMSVRTDAIGHGYGCSASEVRLKRHMLRLGISTFEPDPRGAIEQAESAYRNGRGVGVETVHPVP